MQLKSIISTLDQEFRSGFFTLRRGGYEQQIIKWASSTEIGYEIWNTIKFLIKQSILFKYKVHHISLWRLRLCLFLVLQDVVSLVLGKDFDHHVVGFLDRLAMSFCYFFDVRQSDGVRPHLSGLVSTGVGS